MTAGAGLERGLRGVEIVLGLAALGFVAYLFYGLLGPGSRAAWVLDGARAAPPPLVLTLADSAVIDLHAGEHYDTAFVVDDPRECTVTGRVSGLEGGSRDVEVFLLDREGAAEWHRGVSPAALYESGRASSIDLLARLPGPGEYTLLVSNQYSLFRGKRVLIRDARVVCE